MAVVYKPPTSLKEMLVYPYMDGLPSTVANVYDNEEIAIEVDLTALPKVMADVHREATQRLRARLVDNISEEGRKKFTEDELNFTPHYVALVTPADLTSI